MIRVVCSWLLIVLALSPFTAPFSTCDVSALLENHTSTAIVPWVPASPDLTTLSSIDDAGALSPLIGRVMLSRDSVLAVIGWPVRSTFDRSVRPRSVSNPDSYALQDPLLQSLVLRL
jgi:hypothetical protein